MQEKAIIVGAGTYGQVYAEYLKDEYQIIGFIDDDRRLIGTEINNIKVLGNFEYLLNQIDKNVNVFVPIGNNKIRCNLLLKVRKHGFKTPNFIHHTINIDSSVKIGNEAVYIVQGVIIMPLTIIENDVMISSGTIISHHTYIKQGVFISFGVNVGASIILEKYVYIGIGATVMTGVKKVGENSLIGAGAVIIRDVEDGATVVGNPGKIIKINEITHQ
ncbi:NeuD/PglB/VioB family sugar acetyltransferase [Vaginella massiliensis]|uniref:NeuD/PglB/VioB family sugar acetyltransferase n=1 Tax=Vaginella massiliensis TaxID=1816680 RepID=UPI0037533A3D